MLSQHYPPKSIFRAYDIRGVVDESLTTEVIFDIGRALGTCVLEQGEKQMVVGRDGRLSGPRLLEALCNGIISTGCDVIELGMLPTPLLYFATHFYNIPSGVVITGSHNPADYNGLKMMVGGVTLYEESIQNLYQMIVEQNFKEGQGSIQHRNVDAAYIQALKENITIQKPLKIVIDAGNGVTGEIAPILFKQLGCEVIPLFCEIDGRFPNHHPDPGQPKNLEMLSETVLLHEADLGLAFDGDGDRLGVIDNEGEIIWPDRQLILFARDILSRHSNAQILFDVKCTRHVALDIIKHGGEPLMWKTGHSLIKAKMKETGALLGGEMSGHFFFKERWTGFDDALYAGARLLEIVSQHRESKTVAELFKTIPNSINTPELMMAVSDEDKMDIVRELIQKACFEEAEISQIDGLRVDFKDGFGLVRPSNTGPNLVLRFEGETPQALKRIQTKFRELFQSLEQALALPF
jgi:phosphomannomutase/phosphoglucomutase